MILCEFKIDNMGYSIKWSELYRGYLLYWICEHMVGGYLKDVLQEYSSDDYLRKKCPCKELHSKLFS